MKFVHSPIENKTQESLFFNFSVFGHHYLQQACMKKLG